MTEKGNDIIVPASARIKMRRTEFCSVMFRLWGGKAVAILSILLAVSLVLGIWSDIKFFIITLMVVFIVCPMILGFMYYYYGLAERCYFNVTDHSVEITDEGIKLNMYFPEYPEEEEAESEEKEPKERCIEKIVKFNMLHRYLVRRNSVVFPLGPNRIDGFLWLPESAYENPEEFASAVKLLASKIK